MRIRTVKPEWLDDEALALACPESRVLSIALLLLADDYGNGRCNEAVMAGRVFPGSENPRETLAKALAGLGNFVTRYRVDGQDYFAIRNWSKHQKVDKPGKPLVPGPPENFRETDANPRETLAPRARPDPGPDPGSDPLPSGSSDARVRLTPEHVRTQYVAMWAHATGGKPPPMVARGMGAPVWDELARGLMTHERCDTALAAFFRDGFAKRTGYSVPTLRSTYDKLLLNGPQPDGKPAKRGAVDIPDRAYHAQRVRELGGENGIAEEPI